MHNLTPFHQKIRFENQVIVNSDCIGVCVMDSHGLHMYTEFKVFINRNVDT